MAKEATLYELIFGEAPVILTNRLMWSKLGKGELEAETVERMLEEGYEAMVLEDEGPDEDDKDKKVLPWQDQVERTFRTNEF